MSITPDTQFDLEQIVMLPLADLRPAPENSKVYSALTPDDPNIQRKVESIRRQGILTPLVVTRDGYIVSGNQRFFAAQLVGLNEVPVQILPIFRDDDPDAFLLLLIDYNEQRDKRYDEALREQTILAAANGEAYTTLIEHRAKRSRVKGRAIALGPPKPRSKITAARRPFLEAVLRLLEELENFLPMSIRAMHYRLLNNPPSTNTSRRKNATYANNQRSYKALIRLIGDARDEDLIPNGVFCDDSRPIVEWTVWNDAPEYFREEREKYCRTFARDLLQSQACHFEIHAEKLTVLQTLKPIAMQYTMTLSIGKGFTSYPVLEGVRDRFHASGKDKLVVLLVSDFDPEGECLAEVFARHLRDRMGIEEERIHAVKATLTQQQVKKYRLASDAKAKKNSSRCKKFVAKYGTGVHELEALSPEQLQNELVKAIDSVIDIEMFNAEVDAERDEDAPWLEARRRVMFRAIGEDEDE